MKLRTVVRALTGLTLVIAAALLVAYIGSHTWAVVAVIVLLWSAVFVFFARALLPQKR